MKHIAKKLSKGHYIYRGFKVNCIEYYAPEKCSVWEAVDHDGSGFAHSFTLRDTKRLIDEELDKPKENGKS